MEATRSEALTNNVSINTHFHYIDGAYNDTAGVIAKLQYVGIDTVRDWAPYDALGPGAQHFDIAANAGMKFVLTASQHGTPQEAVQRIHDFVVDHPGVVVGIEGPNEVNNWPVSYNGQTGEAGALAYQQAVFDAVQADPLLANIPVLGFTNYPYSGPQASDANNGHPYARNGDQPREYIANDIAAQAALDPGKDAWITETGYSTSPGNPYNSGVDEATQAKLLLNTVFDATDLGVKHTSIYELLDAYPDASGTDSEKHFGLFRLDGTAKPSAVMLHNLEVITDDDSSTALTFDTGDLNYTVSGAGVYDYLMQQADGDFQLALWREPDIWNEATQQPITVGGQISTINLGQTFATVNIYDPLAGTTPIQTFTNISSFDLNLVDHALIVEASGGTGGNTGGGDDPVEPPASNTLIADTQGQTLWGTALNETLLGQGGSNNLYGAGGDDSVVGYTGNNWLEGNDGNDTVVSGNGDDWMSGGAGVDLFKIDATSGNDMILDFTSGEKLSFTEESASQVTWASGSRFGYSGVEVTHGGGFTFVANVSGLVASDFIFGGTETGTGGDPVDPPPPVDEPDEPPPPPASGTVTLTGTPGQETLRASTDAPHILDGLDGDDAMFGAGGDDTVYGGGGNDWIEGAGGADSLIGGDGADWLTGGAGADVFGFAQGHGTDHVLDFVSGTDKLSFVGMTSASVTQAAGQLDGYNGLFVNYTGGSAFLHDVTIVAPSDFVFS